MKQSLSKELKFAPPSAYDKRKYKLHEKRYIIKCFTKMDKKNGVYDRTVGYKLIDTL